MIEIGIPKLDEFLDGGMPKGKSLLYYIQPGVEGDVFGMQTLYHNLRKGKKGIFITLTTDPSTIRSYFREFGWNLDEFGDNFAIVDAYSGLIGLESKEKYFVEDPKDLDNITEVLMKAVEDQAGEVITCGSLSTIIDIAGEEKALEHIKEWNKYMLLHDSVSIYNFTVWPYSRETLKKMREELFNSVIRVSGIAERVIFGQYYAVLKVDWTELKEKAMMFKVVKPGGVKAFIPKVLVTGPYNAGKSSFVHALSTRAVSVDRLGTTVALDHGHIDHKGFSADVFGTPGQERFDPLLKMLGGEAMGVFLVVDSTKPEGFARAKKMMETTKTFGLPYVVVANKQDLNNALSIEEVRKRMAVGEEVPIVPAVAIEKKGVFEAFETLVDMITEVS